MTSDEIIHLIRNEMERQHVSIRELSRRTGASISNICYWLHGGGITLEKADRVLKAIGLTATIGKEEGHEKDRGSTNHGGDNNRVTADQQ